MSDGLWEKLDDERRAFMESCCLSAHDSSMDKMRHRAYDLLMAGHGIINDPLAEEAGLVKWWGEFKDRFYGVPVLICDQAYICYEHTDRTDGVPLTIPFERFVLDYPLPWGRVAVLCEWDDVARQLSCLAIQLNENAPSDLESTIRPANWFSIALDEEWAAGNLVRQYVKGLSPTDDTCPDFVCFVLSMLSVKNVGRRVGNLPRSVRRHPGVIVATAKHFHYTLTIPGAAVFDADTRDPEERNGKQRLHVVRGHFKNYGEGSGLFGKLHGCYYYAPYLRGNLSVGTVTKDYNVVPVN